MKVLIPLAESGRINTEASIRDSQSIIINAPIEKIWKILADISKWPEWNPSIRSIKLEAFEVGKSFKWNINGANVTSIIRSINAPEMLTWTGSSTGFKSIHVWKLETAESNQTIVSTEESLQGIMTLFHSHQKLHSTLVEWLERLKETAESE